jgi:lantibiotic modifying enzyme
VLRGALGAAGVLSFPRHLWSAAPAPAAHLENAKSAERWIHTKRRPTERGVLWEAEPAEFKWVAPSLYYGAAGVVVFLLELYDATKDKRYLDEALAGARELAAGLPSTADGVTYAALYTGLAGVGFVLDEVHRVSRDAALGLAARRCFDLVLQSAKPAGAGVEWDP